MIVQLPLASGLFVNVQSDLVTCVEEIVLAQGSPPVGGACRLWYSDSAPGQTTSYLTVDASYATVVASLGPPADWATVSVVPYGVGNVGFATSKITAIEQTPGDTACRVTVGSDRTTGYVLVPGDLATVSLLLAPPQPPPLVVPPTFSVTNQVQTGGGTQVRIGTIYVPSNIAPSFGQVTVFSSGATTTNTFLQDVPTSTIVAQWLELVPASGIRVVNPVQLDPLPVGWYTLDFLPAGGTARFEGLYIE